MSDEIKVETTVETPDESASATGEDAAAGRLIDGAVAAGQSAGEAQQHQHAAEQHAEAAATAAAISADAAASAQDGADRTEQLLREMNKLTEQNAQILAMNASMHSQEHAGNVVQELEDHTDEPVVEVEPEHEHWLNRKWFKGFSLGKKADR